MSSLNLGRRKNLAKQRSPSSPFHPRTRRHHKDPAYRKDANGRKERRKEGKKVSTCKPWQGDNLTTFRLTQEPPTR